MLNLKNMIQFCQLDFMAGSNSIYQDWTCFNKNVSASFNVQLMKIYLPFRLILKVSFLLASDIFNFCTKLRRQWIPKERSIKSWKTYPHIMKKICPSFSISVSQSLSICLSLSVHCLSIYPFIFSSLFLLHKHKLLLFLDHLILHLELHVRASRCGGLPSLMTVSAPAIIYTLCCRPWQGISSRCYILENWIAWKTQWD